MKEISFEDEDAHGKYPIWNKLSISFGDIAEGEDFKKIIIKF